MPDDPTAYLAALAQTAVHHAVEVHRTAIAPSAASIGEVDRILDLEGRAAGAEVESLALCYGAWLGELAVRELGAAWIAMHEPVAPRLRVGQMIASPIDAVRRRLTGRGAAPSIRVIHERLRAWAAAASAGDRDAVLATNRAAWTGLSAHPRFANPASVTGDPAAAAAALDPWLAREGVVGKEVLCLGAGGGRHGPLLAAAGARVTVVDISPAQLAHDRRIAEAEGLALRTFNVSLDDLSEFADASFAIVVQPVSSCYVPDVRRVHREVARVLRAGGLYVVQHKQPASLQGGATPAADGWVIEQAYGDGLALPPVAGVAHREAGTAEFLHSLEALVGGLCRAGFVIEDLAEPAIADALAPVGSAEQRACFLPPYLKIKARRLPTAG